LFDKYELDKSKLNLFLNIDVTDFKQKIQQYDENTNESKERFKQTLINKI